MKYKKIIERTKDIDNMILKAGYKELSNNIFIKKVKNKNIIIAETKKYIIFGISSLAEQQGFFYCMTVIYSNRVSFYIAS